jgi:hypothetical protein
MLTLSLFDSEIAADSAAASLKDSGLAKHEAIGVLALDPKGKLKEDKVGARSTKKGAGVGAVLWLLGQWASAPVSWAADCSALYTTKVSAWMTMTRRASARSSTVGTQRSAF